MWDIIDATMCEGFEIGSHEVIRGDLPYFVDEVADDAHHYILRLVADFAEYEFFLMEHVIVATVEVDEACADLFETVDMFDVGDGIGAVDDEAIFVVSGGIFVKAIYRILGCFEFVEVFFFGEEVDAVADAAKCLCEEPAVGDVAVGVDICIADSDANTAALSRIRKDCSR